MKKAKKAKKKPEKPKSPPPVPVAKTRIRLLDLENGMAIWKVHLDLLREQDVNARVMPPKVFEQLTDNIRSDKKLESLPLVMMQKEKAEFIVISGHHRTRAARAGGVMEIHVLAYEEELTKDQIKSKQLAHNSLAGTDDGQILRQIYFDIEDLDSRIATGLTDLEEQMDIGTVNLDEVKVDLDYEVLNIVFLAAEKKKFDDVLALVEKKSDVLVENLKNFDAFKTAIRQISAESDVRNIAAILSKMSDIVYEYYEIKAREEEVESDG